ncbi:MAG: c-type cytochrome [Archangium sp.]
MTPFRSTLLAALMLLGACAEPSVPPRASGSLAVSQDGLTVFAADTDNGLLLVVDAKTLEKKGEVKVGAQPFRVSVGNDGTVYVANRGSRSVSVVSPKDLSVVAELPTGVDPVGMQLSADGSKLYVVSATSADDTSFGTLTAFDTATREQRWVLPVGEEPRGLGLISGERAVISQYKSGRLVEVDLANGTVSKPNVEFYGALNAQALQGPRSAYGLTSFAPRAMTDVAVSPDGTRAFATMMLSREAPILTQPTPDTPYYKGQGPQLAGSVSTGGLVTLDNSTGSLTPQVDDVSGYGYGIRYDATIGGTAATTAGDHPQTSFAVNGFDSSPILQGPSVAVVDSSGDWLFVVNKESSKLAIVSANRNVAKPNQAASSSPYAYNQVQLPSVHSTASIGAGADGVAILTDNKTTLVYSQYEHKLQKFSPANDGTLALQGTSIALAPDTLPADEVLGRKMFHDANNRMMSAVEASVACSSCHLEGRDDGHTWQFPDGPRQTPTLAGRGIKATAPFHWSGEFPDLQAFLTHTITARMGGKGLSQIEVSQLNAYVDSAPAPENPYLQKNSPEQIARGSQVFARAGCDTCHSGQWLTNNTNVDVGSLVLSGINPDNGLVMQGLNVPSLKGLARSAPYLHDGSAMSLKARVLKNPGDKHGVTSTLSTADVDDLVAYLETL